MINPLTLLGLSPKLAKIAAFGIGILLIVGAFLYLLNRVTDAAYDKGKADTEQVYKDAEAALLKQAGEATTKADKQAAVAAVEYAAQVQEEKEKIDDALANGTSPYDVMFPAAE
jgi:hypothetical protein